MLRGWCISPRGIVLHIPGCLNYLQAQNRIHTCHKSVEKHSYSMPPVKAQLVCCACAVPPKYLCTLTYRRRSLYSFLLKVETAICCFELSQYYIRIYIHSHYPHTYLYITYGKSATVFRSDMKARDYIIFHNVQTQRIIEQTIAF